MTTNKLTDLKSEQIDKAVSYYVKELNPAYDESYELMSIPIVPMENIKDLPIEEAKSKLFEYVEYIKDRELEIENSQKRLKIKVAFFEKMKMEFELFDGFSLKEMDNRIKKILN